jgi:hypothetical protein
MIRIYLLTFFLLTSLCTFSQIRNLTYEQIAFNYYLESQLKDKLEVKISYQFKGYSEDSEKKDFTYFDKCPDYSSIIKSNNNKGKQILVDVPIDYERIIQIKNFKKDSKKKSIRLYSAIAVQDNFIVVIEVFDNDEFFSEIYYRLNEEGHVIDECVSSEVY